MWAQEPYDSHRRGEVPHLDFQVLSASRVSITCPVLQRHGRCSQLTEPAAPPQRPLVTSVDSLLCLPAGTLLVRHFPSVVPLSRSHMFPHFLLLHIPAVGWPFWKAGGGRNGEHSQPNSILSQIEKWGQRSEIKCCLDLFMPYSH